MRSAMLIPHNKIKIHISNGLMDLYSVAFCSYLEKKMVYNLIASSAKQRHTYDKMGIS